MTVVLNMRGYSVTNVVKPILVQDIVTKAYADNLIQLIWK